MADQPSSRKTESKTYVADAAALAERALSAAQTAVDKLAAEDPAVGAGASPATAPEGVTGSNLTLPNFQQVLADVEARGIDLLHDVELDVKIELGRTHMLVEDVLRLSEGSVVELDKLAGDPVDVYVNDRLVARGEVLVLNENFCVRISEVVADAARVVAAGPAATRPPTGAKTGKTA